MKLFFVLLSVVLLCVVYVIVNSPYFEKIKSFFDPIIKFLSQIFDKEEPQPDYPVYLGFDGMFFPRLADEEFSHLRSGFDVCFCDRCVVEPNKVLYRFKISGADKIKNDYDQLMLLQKKSEHCLAEHFRDFGCFLPTENLVVVNVWADYLGVAFARNQVGIQEVLQQQQSLRERLLDKAPSVHKEQVFQTSWSEHTPPDKYMNWGYNTEAYVEYGVSVPYRINTSSHCHALITGASGSGKSTALLYLLGSRIQAEPDTIMYICDFKNSDDFRFLQGYSHYYSGDAAYNGIISYYMQFSKNRQGISDGKKYLLIVDEYPALINYLQMQDKQNKTKKATDILGAIAEILMLGRGTGNGFGVWIVTQRPDSTLFSNGARDNFMIFCALGNLSKEQKTMIFPGQEIPDRIFQPGEGMLLADGEEIAEVKFPLIRDETDWKARVFRALKQSGGACADDEA